MATKELKLTSEEMDLVSVLLKTVFDCLSYDDFSEEFIDNGNFLLSLEPSQHELLKKIVKRL